MINQIIKLFLFTLSFGIYAAEPDWSRGFKVTSPRENLYGLKESEFQKTVMAGRKHSLFYPVSVSKLRIPYEPLANFFETEPDDPVRKLLYDLTKVVTPIRSINEAMHWLGLHDFPATVQPETPNAFPELTAEEKSHPMGATITESENGKALTFGCATCHSADMFGVKILGLTNRFPRANEFFRIGAHLAPYVNSFVFKDLLKATEGERQIFVDAKENLRYVGTKKPVSIGLDTSLAQVALSLAKRRPDAYATKDDFYLSFPRRNKLEKMVADSKPAVWWTAKHKNRWLSDGSIISGNPVHTNFLWNEIGRGTDLKELEVWLKENNQTIKELTAAVFASKSPRYEKFFGIDSIDLDKARRGERHFVQSCQRCHGVYEKAWSSPKSLFLSKTKLVQTTKVKYHELTPVIDVGTDPGRYLGMKEFSEDLNRLAISKAIGTVVEPQKGYVPPPLEGIWARYPYLHNNSIPNLCALLTPAKKRPVVFNGGPAVDKELDYDQNCVGYPLNAKSQLAWENVPEYKFDTRMEGLSNRGHDEKIFMKDGQEIYSESQKMELIEFLKTL